MTRITGGAGGAGVGVWGRSGLAKISMLFVERLGLISVTQCGFSMRVEKVSRLPIFAQYQ